MIVIARDFSKSDPFPWCRFIRSSTNLTSPPLVSFSWFLSSLIRVTIWTKVVKYLVEKRCDPDLPTNQGGLHKIMVFLFISLLSSRTSCISFPIETGSLLFAEIFLTARRRDSWTGSVVGFFQAWLVSKLDYILNDTSLWKGSDSEVCVLFTKIEDNKDKLLSGIFEPFFYLVLEEAAPVYFTCHLNNFAASCPIIP